MQYHLKSRQLIKADVTDFHYGSTKTAEISTMDRGNIQVQ